MSTTPHTELSPRAQGWHDSVMEQLETIEERMPENIVKIQRTIGLYERIYDMSSIEMRQKLAAGDIEETNEICAWSQLLTVLDIALAESTQ